MFHRCYDSCLCWRFQMQVAGIESHSTNDQSCLFWWSVIHLPQECQNTSWVGSHTCQRQIVSCKNRSWGDLLHPRPIVSWIWPHCYDHVINHGCPAILIFHITNPCPAVAARHHITNYSVNFLMVSRVQCSSQGCLCNKYLLGVHRLWGIWIEVLPDNVC